MRLSECVCVCTMRVQRIRWYPAAVCDVAGRVLLHVCVRGWPLGLCVHAHSRDGVVRGGTGSAHRIRRRPGTCIWPGATRISFL
jgi:hypothetical protein